MKSHKSIPVLVMALASTSAMSGAGDPANVDRAVISAVPLEPMPEHYWRIELIREDGGFYRQGTFASLEACEAAIPKAVSEQHGFNARCEEVKPK
jgi:hypothetical protein